MIYEMPLPSLGADMDEARFIQWRISVGDVVKKGQVVAEIETTKAAVEIEAFRDGKVLELIAKPDEVIAVGKTIAKLEVEGEAVKEVPSAAAPSPEPATKRLRISPAARRFAEENKIDLNGAQVMSLKGSGPEGAIELKDIQTLKAVDNEPAKGAPEGGMLNIRMAIAKAMSRSKASIPHYYLKLEVNVEKLIELLDKKMPT